MNLICRLFGHKHIHETVCWGANYAEKRLECARCGAKLETYGLTPLGRVDHAIGDRSRRRCWLCHRVQWHMWLGPWGWVCLGYPNQRMHNPGDDVRV